MVLYEISEKWDLTITQIEWHQISMPRILICRPYKHTLSDLMRLHRSLTMCVCVCIGTDLKEEKYTNSKTIWCTSDTYRNASEPMLPMQCGIVPLLLLLLCSSLYDLVVCITLLIAIIGNTKVPTVHQMTLNALSSYTDTVHFKRIICIQRIDHYSGCPPKQSTEKKILWTVTNGFGPFFSLDRSILSISRHFPIA